MAIRTKKARSKRMETRRVKYTILSILLFITGIVSAEIAATADFYVSTSGSDSWSGTLATPNAQGSDGPFATLTYARDAVRDLKGRQPSNDIVVLIREGFYRLSETVVFGLEDSGKDDSTVTYAAYPGEKPVFSSAVEIGGWKKLTTSTAALPAAAHGKVWVTDAPQMKGAPWRFFTLYDAQGRLPRARSKGFIPTKSSSNVGGSGANKSILHFPSGSLKSWPNLEDIEIFIRPRHAWILNILPLESVDEETQIAKTTIPATYPMEELHFLKGLESCWVENVLEALDESGEWILNTEEGKLYLWPRDETPPKGIMAPLLKEYIRVEGRIDEMGPKDIPVRNLCFRGLTFMHGERELWTKGDKGLQHDWEMHDKATAMIRLRGAENCVIENCHFTTSGGSAIRVDLYGQDNRIVSNHIEHIGGTGVLLCGYGPGAKDVNKRNLIVNNHIHHTGEIYWHAPGLFLWQSGENRVANNLIHNTPYSGMIISGLTDSFKPKLENRTVGDERGRRGNNPVESFRHSRNNLIEYNEIHHAMELLGDGNGIYIRGAGSGNIIRRNYIHHLLAQVVMQSAIRTDGGQRDTLIAENLIYKCVSHGIHLKLNNRAENNIIADIIEAVHKGQKRPVCYFKLREGPLTGGSIQRNILYHTGSRGEFYDQGTNPRLPAAWAKEADTDYNIYYCPGNSELSQKELEQTQGDGIDAHSLTVDPLFVDPENGDFRLKPDSPALKLGFVPFDMSKVGLRATKD